MRRQKILGALPLFSVLLALATCQIQLNRIGNGLTVQVVVPGGLSGAEKNTVVSSAGPRALDGGASITVTISQASVLTEQQTQAVNGNGRVDFSFSLSSGTYDVSAVMQDANGITLAQGSTGLTVPTGNYPVVLTLLSSLLSNLIVSDISGAQFPLVTPFSPTTYNCPMNASYINPIILTLTTLDPKATITVTQNLAVVSPSGSDYTVTASLGAVTIVVTAADGSFSLTYTWTPNGG